MNEPVASALTRRSERRAPLLAPMGERIGAGIIAALCLAVLSLSAWLTPDAKGHGTHTKLGLTPCMWAETLDRPCPTCGMTTSFTHAGEGQWLMSATTQPLGALLVVMTAVVFWGALTQAVSGARLGTAIQPALRPSVFIAMGLLLLASWMYKIATWQ